ncbi:hypothetical protein O181_024302 [Austropuccinia psidii MF-1]|uniref:6-phosphogluconolactonase n=1 Tax=Austropuccinia psidii MF-1 TaxID=1389203 RepID=A0A9Q3GYV2_9BASI|nr:hypothetical protein [Austropuccinia psidii MF-1]
MFSLSEGNLIWLNSSDEKFFKLLTIFLLALSMRHAMWALSSLLVLTSASLASKSVKKTQKSPLKRAIFQARNTNLTNTIGTQGSKTFQFIVGGDSKTVKLFEFDSSKKTLKQKASSDSLGPSATWLDFDPTHKFILSASVSKFQNVNNSGGVFSARFAADGSLTKISSSSTPDTPVSVQSSKDGKHVFVACYNGGALATYNMDLDGKLSTAIQNFRFTGSGPDKERQATASAHQARLDSTGRLLLVPDLGSDRVHSFSVSASGRLSQNPDVEVKPGCGPRHLSFDPDSTNSVRFYLLCELSSDIFFMEIANPQEKARIKQTLTALPKGANASTFNAAEILITPDKKFLYITNRVKDPQGKIQDNKLGVFRRAEKSGELKLIDFFPAGGKGPRHFAFSPDRDASFVLVANRDSELITIHSRDVNTGALKEVASTKVEAPTVILVTS